MSKHQDFDSEIFEVTKIMIGFSLTDGQKTELLKIADEIEAACQDGSLSADERQRLLETMADCGLELPQASTEPCVDETKLQERLTQYMELDLFHMDIGALIIAFSYLFFDIIDSNEVISMKKLRLLLIEQQVETSQINTIINQIIRIWLDTQFNTPHK